MSRKSKRIIRDGWYWYEEPVNWVAAVNDTGMSQESPCPTDLGENELRLIVEVLNENHINFSQMSCNTWNPFFRRKYIVVDSRDLRRTVQLIESVRDNFYAMTRLLFVRNSWVRLDPKHLTFEV
jgi:hypothetical protein